VAGWGRYIARIVVSSAIGGTTAFAFSRGRKERRQRVPAGFAMGAMLGLILTDFPEDKATTTAEPAASSPKQFA